MLQLGFNRSVFWAGFWITVFGALGGYGASSYRLSGMLNAITFLGLIVIAFGILTIDRASLFRPKPVIHTSLTEALEAENRRAEAQRAAYDLSIKQEAEAKAARERQNQDDRLPQLQYLLLHRLGIQVQMPATSPINIEGHWFGVDWDEQETWTLFLYRPCDQCGELKKAHRIKFWYRDYRDVDMAIRDLSTYLASADNGYLPYPWAGRCPKCGT